MQVVRTVKESTIEREVVRRALVELGVASIKWGQDGWPDRCFLIPGGRPLFIEFKRPGGKVSPKQDYYIRSLKDLGYDAEVCDDVERAVCCISRALDSAL